MRTRSAAARCGCATSPTRKRWKARLEQLASAPQRAAARSRPAGVRPRRADRQAARRSHPAFCLTPPPVWRLLDRGPPQRPPHPVRGRARGDARCRSRHLPVRDLVEHIGGPGRRRGRASLRVRLAMSLASPRPIRPASAAARSRPSCRTISAAPSASAGASSASLPVGRGAAAGLMRCMVRQAIKTRRDRRHRLDQARRARRV